MIPNVLEGVRSLGAAQGDGSSVRSGHKVSVDYSSLFSLPRLRGNRRLPSFRSSIRGSHRGARNARAKLLNACNSCSLRLSYEAADVQIGGVSVNWERIHPCNPYKRSTWHPGCRRRWNHSVNWLTTSGGPGNRMRAGYFGI